MHYYKDPQNREKRLTRDFVGIHIGELCRALALSGDDKIVVELQKERYGRRGEIDLAIWKNPGTAQENLIAVEIKVIVLEYDDSFSSEKWDKHNKQLNRCVEEGWDYVCFFDFIVTRPAAGWLHPQSFAGYDNYTKTVEAEICGHMVFQINSVAHKPESMAGSISWKKLRGAAKNQRIEHRDALVGAMNTISFCGPVFVDSVDRRPAS